MEIPFYMTAVTIYFLFLPFLLTLAIYQIKKGSIKKHITSQLILFVFSLIVIIYFEIMLRISGGYLNYKQYSSFSESFMLIYLIIHILIALLAVILWAYVIFSSIKTRKKNGFDKKRHKFLGIITFILLTISSIMGAGMYYMLFLS